MAAVVRSVVCSGRGAAGSLSSVLRGTGSSPYNLAGNTCSSILVGAVTCPTVTASSTASGPAVSFGAGSGPTVSFGAGSGPTVLGSTGSGTTVSFGAGSVPTVLGGTRSGTTVCFGAGSGPTVLGGIRSYTTLTGTRASILGVIRDVTPDTMIASSSRSTGASNAIASGSARCFSSSSASSTRSFSSSSSSSPLREKLKAKWHNHKPGDNTVLVCTLLGAGGAMFYCIDRGYKFVLQQSQKASLVYIDQKLTIIQEEHKKFQHIATGTHLEFVRKCQEATAEMQKEVSQLHSRMLALEAKKFKHSKELIIAAKILEKAGVGDDAAVADAAAAAAAVDD